MAHVRMYTKDPCPYCVRAKAFLNEKGVQVEEIDLTDDFETLNRLKNETGWRTVPMIFIGEKLVGGYSDLKALDDEGKLDDLLKA
jgi:glutaredoxin 3